VLASAAPARADTERFVHCAGSGGKGAVSRQSRFATRMDPALVPLARVFIHPPQSMTGGVLAPRRSFGRVDCARVSIPRPVGFLGAVRSPCCGENFFSSEGSPQFDFRVFYVIVKMTRVQEVYSNCSAEISRGHICSFAATDGVRRAPSGRDHSAIGVARLVCCGGGAWESTALE